MKTFECKPNYFVTFAIIAVSLIFTGCGKLGSKFAPDVHFVREGSFAINQSVKVGDAFDQFFTNGKWKSFKSTNNERIVEFTGEFMLSEHPDLILTQLYTGNFNALSKNSKDVPAKTMIQFVIDGGGFNIRYMEINGVTMDNFTILTMVEKVINSYKAVPR